MTSEKKLFRIRIDGLPSEARRLTSKIRRHNLFVEDLGIEPAVPELNRQVIAVQNELSKIRTTVPWRDTDEPLIAEVERLGTAFDALISQVHLLVHVAEVRPKPEYRAKVAVLRARIPELLEAVEQLEMGGMAVDLIDDENALFRLPSERND